MDTDQYLDGIENDDPFAILNEDLEDCDEDEIYAALNDYEDNIVSNIVSNIKVEFDNEEIMNKFAHNIRYILKNGNRNVFKLTLRDVAARIIQRTWKNYIDRMIFKYIQNILHNCMENPFATLKNINPNESQLLDVISGTFIRFRLCGKTFPPKIVYKIFTRRPVVAIGSALCYLTSNEIVDEYPKLKPKTASFSKFNNNNWRVGIDTELNILKKLQQISKIKQRKSNQPIKKIKTKSKDIQNDKRINWMNDFLDKFPNNEHNLKDYFLNYM